MGAAAGPGISPILLADHYRFPEPFRGRGQRIAIIALGGGYHEEDLTRYFDDVLGLPAPRVRAVSVGGATNAPLDAGAVREMVTAFNDPTLSMADLAKRFGPPFGDLVGTAETTMDVQVAGACAPEAEIDVYFASNDAAGMYHALYAAVGLGTDERNPDGTLHQEEPATTVSLSWGWPEATTPGNTAGMIERALQQAWALGSLVCCASGDWGSLGQPGRSSASVLFPASSTAVLACGGTMFTGQPGDPSSPEVPWNDENRGTRQATGGGVSGVVPLPPWQSGACVPSRAVLNGSAWLDQSLSATPGAAFVGRGVPDVSAYADQLPGYRLVMGGVETAAGGTSAAAPLWAGLGARLAEALGRRVPWLPRVIYDPRVAGSFRAVGSGDNRLGDVGAAFFDAGPGWNPCCGLGVPDGTTLLEALRRTLPPPS